MKKMVGVCVVSFLVAAGVLTGCTGTSGISSSSEEPASQPEQSVAAYEDHVVPEDALSDSSNRVHVTLPSVEQTESSSSASASDASLQSSEQSDKSASSSSGASEEKSSSAASKDKSEASSDDVGDYFDNNAGGVKIMGKSAATIDDMVEMYNQSGNRYPSDELKGGGAPTIKDFCTIIAREAVKEGVRADVVFVQSMHETGWLQFGNQVSIDQFNFAGIGAVDSGGEGAHFKSVAEGIRAQVQHLKAYASTDKLNNECIDPRFDLVSRGCAPEIKDLSRRWASGPTYGDTLQSKVDELDAYA